jgi:hypothetical protein
MDKLSRMFESGSIMLTIRTPHWYLRSALCPYPLTRVSYTFLRRAAECRLLQMTIFRVIRRRPLLLRRTYLNDTN